MVDFDEPVYGAAEDWFILAADDVTHHGDSDDAAFDRWLASLPRGGIDDALDRMLGNGPSAPFERGVQRSGLSWRD